MNTTQRKIVLIVSVILAPLFFLWGWGEGSPMAIVAPVASVGIGIWVWSGRDK